MFDFFKDRLEARRKREHEIQLKEKLAEKLSKRDYSVPKSSTADTTYTEITINGEKMRLEKEHITVTDVASITN
jgi:hypothetical protein